MSSTWVRSGIVAGIAIIALLALLLGRVAFESRRELAAANAYRQDGLPARAIEHYRRAVEIDPDSATLAVRLVQLQLRSGRYTEAAVTLSESLDRHPTDPGLLRLADRLQREIGIP